MSKDMYIEGGNVTPVVKALSNDVRLQILNLLSDSDMNVQTLASHLKLSKTAVLTHVNILEQTGFIKSQYLSGSVGNQRICHKMYDRLIFNFDPGKTDVDEITYYETEIPVGNFFDFEVWAPCGLASHNNIIQKWDDPAVFCDIKRVNAALVWTAFGYLEYKIPLDPLFVGKNVTAIEIEMEISAHQMVKTHKSLVMPPYMTQDKITDGISEVTLWMNDTEVGTITITVGEDSEKATYTPTWWRSLPVHGIKLNARIGADGCYINKRKTSERTFEDIVHGGRFIRLRVGVKKDAVHSSGIMIFGKEFGRYCNDIIVKSYIE